MKNEMTISRESLAMKLFVRDGFNPKEAFDAADLFIAECERQKREPRACTHKWVDSIVTDKAWMCDICENYKAKPEPPKTACEHRWASINDGPVRCLNCDAKKPEPPKSERVAREVWVDFNACGGLWDVSHKQNESMTRIKFREVLE